MADTVHVATAVMVAMPDAMAMTTTDEMSIAKAKIIIKAIVEAKAVADENAKACATVMTVVGFSNTSGTKYANSNRSRCGNCEECLADHDITSMSRMTECHLWMGVNILNTT
jgi:hypothetical protein